MHVSNCRTHPLSSSPPKKVIDDNRERVRSENLRLREAIQSPKWSARLTADHTLAHLKVHSLLLPPEAELKDAAAAVLHRMVRDGQFSRAVCSVLDAWKRWADNAGMREEDFAFVKEHRETFAWASMLVATISEAGEAVEGSLASDLQECLRIWKNVRLG